MASIVRFTQNIVFDRKTIINIRFNTIGLETRVESGVKDSKTTRSLEIFRKTKHHLQ